MGYPTKVQLIKRKASEQWHINLPSAVAQAMEFPRGQSVEWIIEYKRQLILRRVTPPVSALKLKVTGILTHLNQFWNKRVAAFNRLRVTCTP